MLTQISVRLEVFHTLKVRIKARWNLDNSDKNLDNSYSAILYIVG